MAVWVAAAGEGDDLSAAGRLDRTLERGVSK
jgi:hypothetical protein